MATPRTRTPLRRTAYVLLWILTLGLALFTGWRWFGPDLTWPVVVLVSFTPYIAAATVLPIALSIWLRAIRLLTAAVLCACALVVLLIPRALADNDQVAGGPKLNVMSVNLLAGGSDLDTVIELVADNDIDILSVQELTPDAAETLTDSAVGDRLSHHLLKPGTKAAGTGIFSRFPLTEDETLSSEGVFHNPGAVLDVPDYGDLEFQAVHPAPPINPDRTVDWKADLRALPRPDTDGPPRILAGDFNATHDHKTFGELLDAGYDDAAAYTGSGLTGTWPGDKPIPRVAIDHILTAGGITPTAYAVHSVPGGDHLAITATLALPKPED